MASHYGSDSEPKVPDDVLTYLRAPRGQPAQRRGGPLMGESRSAYVVAFRDGGGYVSLNKHYWPWKIERVTNPLDADRFSSRRSGLDTVAGVFKARREDYVTRRLFVWVVK